MTTPEGDKARAGTWLRSGGAAMSRQQTHAGLVVALLLLAAGIFTLREFLPALAWTVIFAIALWPLFQRMAARWPQHRRELLPAAFVLGVVLVFAIPIVIVAIPLAADGHAAREWVRQVRQNGLAPPHFLGTLPLGHRLVALWQEWLSQPGRMGALTRGTMLGSAARVVGTVGGQTIHRVVLLGFMLLGLFFFLRDADDVLEQLRVASRRAFGEAGEDIGRQIVSSVHGTVNGLVLVGLGEGLIMGMAYLIVGLPHPTLFGLITGILAMVPYGAAVGIGIAVVVLVAKGSTVAAVVIVVLGTVVTFVADHFVRPVLIGGATRLPFIWVLLGILGGVTTWGLAGLFIGPALMAALILLWREWIGAQQGPLNPAAGEAEVNSGLDTAP